MKRVLYLLIVTVCLTLSQSFAAQAQANVPALPPAAQEALNKGIIAAKVPDYLLAIRFFEEARKLAPAAPVVFLNLGIAESKIAGRELRAMAWFGAYLAASPDAPNAAAVREQIAVLDVRNQSNISRFLKAVQDAAGQFSDHKKRDALWHVGELWAKAGDIPSALNIAGFHEDEDARSHARHVISEFQAARGDIKGAQKTASLIQIAVYKERAQAAIAKAEAEIGRANVSSSRKGSVSNWLVELDHNNLLNTGLFLDFSGYLQSLNTSRKSRIARENEHMAIFRRNEVQIIFDDMRDTAKELISRQIEIDRMLKQQAGN